MKSRGPGRPPTRPKDLVVFTAQMSPQAKRRLKAIAQVEGSYAYTLLEEAFWQFWEQLPDDKRSTAETIAAAIEKVEAPGDA